MQLLPRWKQWMGACVVVVTAGACSGSGGDSSSSSSGGGGSTSSGGGFSRPSSTTGGSSMAGGSSGGGGSSMAGGSSGAGSTSRASSVGGSSAGGSSAAMSSSRASSGVVGSSSAGGSSGVVSSSRASSGVVVSSSAGGGSSGVVVSSSAGGGSSGVVVSSSAGGSSSVGGSSGMMAVCGNGIPEAGEECDQGAGNDNTGACTTACRNAVCGDRFIHVGTELCDDGNMTANDGCDACQVELGYAVEVEPNGSTNLADGLTQFHTRFATIHGVGDADYYVFVPNVTTRIRAETLGADAAPCQFGITDTYLELLDSSGNVITANDDRAGGNYCSLLDPDTNPLTAVTAGQTYYLRVTDLGNNGIIPNYRVRLALQETAGDNNAAGGALAAGLFTPMVVGNINPAGDVDNLAINVATVGDLVIWVSDASLTPTACPADLTLRLLNSLGSELAYMDDGAVGQLCPLMDPRVDPDGPARRANLAVRGIGQRYRAGALSPSTYVLQVGTLLSGVTAQNYFVRWAYSSICGDGVQAGSERCDSSGAETATCTRACESITAEVEPNGSTGVADPMEPRTVRTGAIGTVGDVDYYLFTVPAAGARFQAWTTTASGDFTNNCTGLDTEIAILDSSGTQLVFNDDSLTGTYCSFVDSVNIAGLTNGVMAAGTYYVRVNEHLNDATTGTYQVHLDYAH